MDLLDIETFGKNILCIDDSTAQLALYKDLLEGMYQVRLAETYEEAIAALSSARPDLILLDMNMPRVSGLEFLDILRYSQQYAGIPVIIVSGDTEGQHIKEAFRKGAADYVCKPYDAEELTLRILRIFKVLDSARRAEREAVSPPVSGAYTPAQHLLVRSLGDLASAKDNEGTNHLNRVGLYAKVLAETATRVPLFKVAITDDFTEKIAEMARLHDIGMVNMSESLIKKDGPLSDREREYVKTHTSDGARMIDMIRLSFPDYGFLDFARDIIIGHHERWDGRGYPAGISGRLIPLCARVTAIVDTFDAVMIDRPYAKGIGFDQACAVIEEGKGTAFDPDLVEAFRFCKARFREIANTWPIP